MDELGENLSTLGLLFTLMSLSTSPHPFILILCYIIHELGHMTFARLTGAKIGKMRAGVFHLSLSYDCSRLTYGKEILVCAGGIIFNLLSVAITCFFPFLQGEVYDFFKICSISLALMNLYPISILDGGGILKGVLLLILPEGVAEKASEVSSFIFAILMWLLAVYLQLVFSSNLSLFFISVLLLIQLCFVIK
ncbi:MAG: site-2 protease family protein [Clostridia bacterium]|nr:site-2 protease family protein [Clostridia bacterium]